MYDAELDRGLRENTCNRIRKALEPVNTSYEDVLDSSVLENSKPTAPEVGTLALGYVNAQKLFPSFGTERQPILSGPGPRHVLPDHSLLMNSVQPAHDTPHV